MATPRVKDKLTIAVVAAMLSGLVAAGFTAITIALNYRSAVFSAAGAPGGIYVADLALWLLTAFLAWAAWQRSPGRLAQVVIKKTPAFQGRTRDQVEASGIRTVSANGTEAFHPWATIDQVRETTRAFHLLDHNGRARAILPKRALDSPDLLPALRTFLKQALEQQQPAPLRTRKPSSPGTKQAVSVISHGSVGRSRATHGSQQAGTTRHRPRRFMVQARLVTDRVMPTFTAWPLAIRSGGGRRGSRAER